MSSLEWNIGSVNTQTGPEDETARAHSDVQLAPQLHAAAYKDEEKMGTTEYSQNRRRRKKKEKNWDRKQAQMTCIFRAVQTEAL